MYNNIPLELRQLTQWVVWRYVTTDDGKPTKLPYNPRTGHLASTTDPNTWASFDEAVRASANGYDGIGYVFTRNDPYCGIDLDSTEDPDALNTQMRVYNAMQSYSERSPSGKGLHIIVKANLPHGRRRSYIEVYSSERYFTFTGNVFLNAPIQERQALTYQLWEEMGQNSTPNYYAGDPTPSMFDDELMVQMQRAVNGDLFNDLWAGHWQHRYPSQSEADQALMNYIVFHTKNRPQAARLFKASALGQRDKAQRYKYIEYTLNKAFDMSLPPIDMDGIVNQVNAAIAQQRQQVQVIEHYAEEPATDEYDTEVWRNVRPPGILGGMVDFILAQAPYPVYEIALAGAVGLMAGICGRAYNVLGTGLNQYLMLLAATGSNKEAMSSGVNKIVTAVANAEYPAIRQFVGPSDMASGTGLIRHLSEAPSPCFVAITGEIGMRLQQMSSANANAGDVTLRRTLLQLYQESGAGQTHNAMVYADKKNNIEPIHSPAFSWLGESTPEEFYKSLSEEQIASGLIPRFLIIEYKGSVVEPSDHYYKATVPPALVANVRGLADTVIKLIVERQQVLEVQFTAEAYEMHKAFRSYCNVHRNDSSKEAFKQLWNRVHLKANKIAAILAIAHNYHSPIIDPLMYRWAISLVLTDVRNVVGKFETGEVGVAENMDAAQMDAIKKNLHTFITAMPGSLKSVPASMHQTYTIPLRVIMQRCTNLSAFRNDRRGGGIQRVLKMLVEMGVIAELPYQTVIERFGEGQGRCYVISNANWFMS